MPDRMRAPYAEAVMQGGVLAFDFAWMLGYQTPIENGYTQSVARKAEASKRDDTMKLYLFMKAEYLLDCLKNDEIKVALPKDCNDPFECMPRVEDGKPMPDTSGVGFICFSKEWASSTMWAHYADKHQGVCLEFSFNKDRRKVKRDTTDVEGDGLAPEVEVIKVKRQFVKQFTELPDISEKNGAPSFIPLMMKVKYAPYRAYPAENQVLCAFQGERVLQPRYSRLYAAKGQEWAYEKEWRLFVNLDNCLSYHDGCYFVKGLTKHISKIMLGWKCKMPLACVQKEAVKYVPSVPCMKMAPNGNLFAVKEVGKDSDSEMLVWRMNLECKPEEWRAIKEYIKRHIGIDNMKGIDYNQAIIDLLINQSQDSNNQETK